MLLRTSDSQLKTSAGAARLLLIGLEALGQRRVEHEANIGAVDPHAKGDGCHHHIDRLTSKGLLGGMPLVGIEAGMIWPRHDSLGSQPGGQILSLPPRETVDDRRLAPMAAKDFERLPDAIGAGDDTINQIGPIERADEHLGVAEVQLGGDILADPRRGRRREGMKARRGKPLPQHGQLAVFRTEVVAPMADAVGLVDGEPLHAHAGQQVEQPGVDQPLRRRKEQP